MRILVVEDEQIVARRLIRIITGILGDRAESVRHLNDVFDGLAYVRKNPIDLLFLDLNLNGSDGFRMLMEAVSGAFQTIIVSAHAEQAIHAYEFGVTDFVAKPFSEERLKKALDRALSPDAIVQRPRKFLAVRSEHQLRPIAISEILYLRGADDYSEVHCKDGSIHLHDRRLQELERMLPRNFHRIHKSYLVNLDAVTAQERQPGSRYRLILNDGERIPVSRKKINWLRTYFCE